MSRWKLLFATSAMVLPSAVFAQSGTAPQGASAGLEEIVVTARRSSETLLNVPVAVSAISKATIERSHVADLTSIGQLSPNVMISPTNNGAAISIRGVGTAGFDPGIDQSVSINLDGVSVGRAKIVLASQFDLQQIEILKGPQALFFGKNSPAGVISIASADPTRTLSAMGRIGYETEASEKYAEAFISGPISDTLGFRIAGKYSRMSGWQTNNAVAGPNAANPAFPVPGRTSRHSPQDKSWATRLTLKWDPSDVFSANFKYTIGRLDSDSDGASETYCRGANPSITSIGVGLVTDTNADCKLNQKITVGNLPTAFRAGWAAANKKNGNYWYALDTQLGSLTLNWNPSDDLTLTSVTGYAKLHSRGFENIDRTSFAVIVSAPNERARTWTQEVRLASSFEGPLNFVMGGYYESAKRSNIFQPMLAFAGNLGLPGFDAANGGSAYSFTDIWRTNSKTYSAFGQLRWKLIENVELSGGVRYSQEKKDSAGENLYLNPIGSIVFGLAPVGQVVRAKNKFSNWSPEITLSYKPTTNMMIYGAYKSGFKAGGLSTPATISPLYVTNPELIGFKPEKSKGFEAGLKGELFDRTVRFDVTVYRYTFSDLQLTSFNPILVAYFVNNAGKSRTTGIEGSVAWKVTPELTFNGGASYTKAKFVEFTGAQCYADITGTPACPAAGYDRSGQPLPRSPKWTLSGGLDYVREIGGNLKIGIGGDAFYNSSFWTSELGNPAGIVDGFWKFNANIRIGAADDKWELAVIGRNLTNEYYPLVTSDATLAGPGNYGAYVLRPRQIALQATVRF